MGRYFAARLIQLVFVLLGVSVVVFVTMHLLPGDVAQLLLGDHATNEQLARLRQQLGLDQPVWVQYLRFHARRAAGDLGTSLQSGHPALDDVLAGVPGHAAARARLAAARQPGRRAARRADRGAGRARASMPS